MVALSSVEEEKLTEETMNVNQELETPAWTLRNKKMSSQTFVQSLKCSRNEVLVNESG